MTAQVALRRDALIVALRTRVLVSRESCKLRPGAGHVHRRSRQAAVLRSLACIALHGTASRMCIPSYSRMQPRSCLCSRLVVVRIPW